MIRCFEIQTYPKDRMEWIIIDDGTDKIEDLVKDVPQIKYFKYDKKMTLGKKRNLMHDKSKGDIIVYMDDDDYYPPERVSHAVEMLTNNKKALCAGSSELYIYFKHINAMYQFGPYGPNHSTAGTFAFKRELLKRTRYDDTACLAEEKAFLKDYTIPFVQLDPVKTILVFSHNQNTFDKKKLLDNPGPFVKLSDKTVDLFVKEPDMKKFYMEDIEGLLEQYTPGNIENKPDVVKQLGEINKKREEMIESNQLKNQLMAYSQMDTIIKQQQQTISKQQEQIIYLEKKIRELITEKISNMKAANAANSVKTS
jgi:glycosyltransferase involved in cell wall biosynthesis